MIGKTLAHYEILAKVGEGGMGEVYRARDTKLDREVAVKILPREMSGDPERIARFQREARTLASLQHANIASIYGFEDDPSARFLVMELVEGEDLSERLKRGALSVEDAKSILFQLIDGLEAAHERGIVHRDLKPANIKIDENGVAKILDFGLARAYTGDTERPENLENSPTITAAMTQAGTILGTAAYMSPEQAKGRTVDRRADIWACGVILWEMLTGQKLFVGDSLSDTLAGVLRQEVDLNALPPSTPTSMRNLLRKCLERDPRQRLQHIGDARIFFEEGGSATPDAAPGNPVIWRWIAVGLAVGALAMAAMLLFGRDTTPGTREMVRRWSFEQTIEGVGTHLVARIAPDGRSIAYVDGAGVWVRGMDDLRPRRVFESSDCTQLTWAPDSQSILIAQGNHLMRLAPTGGQAHPIGVVAGGAPSESGTITLDDSGRLVLGTGMGPLLHIPTLGAESEVFLPLQEGVTDIHQVATIPGGAGWIFVVHEEGGNYGRLDLYTPDGEPSTILNLAPSNITSVFVDPAGYLIFQKDNPNSGIWAAPFSIDDLALTGAPFLVAAGGTDASVSNDGTLVYTDNLASNQGELVWIDRDGTHGAALATITTTRPFPRLLPGDDEFVIPVNTERGRDLWTFNAETGLGRQIYKSEMVEEVVVPSTDGTMLYTYASAEKGYMIYRFPLRSPAQIEPLTIGLLPDPREDLGFLYYSRLRENGFTFDICELALDQPEAQPRVLLGSDHVNWGASVSPDGKYLAYSSDEGGDYQIYLTELPEARARWQVSAAGGHWPIWRADGHEIFFSEGEGIYGASFDGVNGVRIGTPDLLFEYATTEWNSAWASGFDVNESGDRFLVLQRPPTESDRTMTVTVVENWATEFARSTLSQ